MCVIELYKLPLKASFGLVFEEGWQFILLHLIPVCIFLMELLLNFNLGYYEDGEIVSDRLKII
jgi:hypothetical protein